MADVTPADAAEELLRRRGAAGSLHEFVIQAWPQVEAGRPFKDNWHIKIITEHIQELVKGNIRNLLINIPPRMSKSSVCAVMTPAWVWIDQPHIQFLFSSYVSTLSKRDSRKCRSLIRSRWYQTRWGDRFSILDDSDTIDRFDNNKSGYRIATSVDGVNTGEGADILVFDDLNSVRDQSDVALNSTLDWWTSVMPTRMNDFKTARRLSIQQRVHEKDISGHIIANDDEKDWVRLILPMEYEKSRVCITVPLPSTKGKPWRDPRKDEGELLDPNRIGPVEVARLKRELASQYSIAGQLQQRPAPAEGGIIKRAWFKTWQQTRPPKCEFTIMSVDTSLTDTESSAYNAATTWGVFFDEHKVPNVIFLSMWRERCEYPELRKRLLRMSENYLDDGPHELPSNVAKHRPDIVLVEAEGFGRLLIRDLHRAGVNAHGFNPTGKGDKTQRVRIVTPILEGGRMWVPGVPPEYTRLRPAADAFVHQCCPAGTRIVTRDGVKNIEDVRLGDYVLTHRGRFRAVSNTFSNKTDTLVRVKGKMLDEIKLTPGHPVYSPRLNSGKVIGDVRWVTAADLQVRARRTNKRGDRLVSEVSFYSAYDAMHLPIVRAENPVSSISLREYVETEHRFMVAEGNGEFMPLTAAPMPIKNEVLLDYKAGRFFGLFLAEGCFTGYQLKFSFHEKEQDFIREVREFVSERFGAFATNSYKTGRAETVTFGMQFLAPLFRDFGYLAHGKKIPWWVWDAPTEFKKGIVDGWIDGDGHEIMHEGRKVISGATVSQSLAWGIRLLLAPLGISASIKEIAAKECVFRGKVYKARTQYHVGWYPSAQFNFAVWSKEFLAYAIHEKEIVAENCDVYNLSVLEDESYVTTGGTVHNCTTFPRAESRDLVDTMSQALYRLIQSAFIWVPGDPEPGQSNERQQMEAFY